MTPTRDALSTYTDTEYNMNIRVVKRLLPYLIAVCAAAQHPGPALHSHGRAQFEKFCASCHGASAKGARGPDLTGALRHGALQSDIVQSILAGIPGSQMPAFSMPRRDAEAIAAYLVYLRNPGGDSPVTGDANAGRKFFSTAGCIGCHMYQGVGGRLGPDLSGIGQSKSVVQIADLIGKPHQKLAEGFQTVELRMHDGRTIRGVRKNEDTFSIQVMDTTEKLHLLLKKDVAEIKAPQRSLMPETKLSVVAVNDLVAFLKTAPEGQPRPWTPASDLNVSAARLEGAEQEPGNWLTYWGDLRGTHYSRLDSVNAGNVQKLTGAWAYQFGEPRVETTPLAVDGILFVTGPRNSAMALDARTGKQIWRYQRRLPSDIHTQCTVMTNRGVAILGDRLYMATLDAHLVALDAKTGNVIWDKVVGDYKVGLTITLAPLAIDGAVIVGVTAGECALTGYVDAYNPDTGARLWRLPVTPPKGHPARATWSGDSADFGGGPTWMTGTYDASSRTLFWTTGNPSPDYNGEVRKGDNLYTCSVLAIDPKTGKLKWHFQFTPHDTHDWDSQETPVLIDDVWKGRKRHLLIHADRNAFFYVLDRDTGEFLAGAPFAKQTWAKGLDDKGRPIVIPGTDPTPAGVYVCPDAAGATNWAAPSWHPGTKLLYVSARDSCATYTSSMMEPDPGKPYGGSGQNETSVELGAGIRAIDPQTSKVRWDFKLNQGSFAAGVLATAGGLVFAASREGNLIALNASTGEPLWHYQTGAPIQSAPMSYSVDGRQYIAVAGDSTLFVFALPEAQR
jgi:PQQ-dependent dehydrogenase (methanol/ethanol family)